MTHWTGLEHSENQRFDNGIRAPRCPVNRQALSRPISVTYNACKLPFTWGKGVKEKCVKIWPGGGSRAGLSPRELAITSEYAFDH